MKKKETIHRRNDNIWKIALALVCLGILGYGFLYSKNTTADIAFLVGYNLPLALIIWGIFYAAVVRKQGAKVGGFSFLAIFICMIASSLIGYSQQKQEAIKVLSEIKDQYSKILESSTDSRGLPKCIETPIKTTPKAHGEFGEIERFIKEFMAQMVSLRNDYLLELEAIGWNSILDPNRIKEDKTFVESRVIIQKARGIVKKYTDKTTNLLNDAKNKIRSLNISESSKRSMLSGFDRGMKEAKENIDAMWSLEAKTIDEFENIITFLAARKGAWFVKGEQILFYNDSDLERFNFYIASIQNIMKQQEQIQRQSIQIVNRNFNRFKEN